jgi:hypothetical protein
MNPIFEFTMLFFINIKKIDFLNRKIRIELLHSILSFQNYYRVGILILNQLIYDIIKKSVNLKVIKSILKLNFYLTTFYISFILYVLCSL